MSFWSTSMPLHGRVVFDGELDLDDYRICVGDIEGIGRWTQRIRRAGPQRVVVQVDDPGYASRIHVGLDLGPDARELPVPSTGGPSLFTVLTSEPDGPAPPDERGLVLDGHDLPHARLTAALSLLPRPEPTEHQAGDIAEWLRWLRPDLSHAEAAGLGGQLRHLMRDAGREGAATVARTILDAALRHPR